MQHLTCEELARLVDEPPLPHEAAHVRDCLVCRRELEEMRGQTRLMASLGELDPSPGAWHELEAELNRQGLIRVPARGFAGWTGNHPLLRAAAAVTLFLLGGASGVAIWNRTHPAAAPVLTVQGPPAVAVRAPGASQAAEPTAIDPAPAPVAPNGVVLASNGGGDPGPRPRPKANSEAVRAAQRDLDAAEGAYVAALQRYAAVADPASGADPETRLAALERMIATTRKALDRAPDDPVINGYHLAAVRARDELQRQMAEAEKDWF